MSESPPDRDEWKPDSDDRRDKPAEPPTPAPTPVPERTPSPLSQVLQEPGPWRAYVDLTRTVHSGGAVEEFLAQERTFGEGQLLAGRFQVLRYLGGGGMGEVYEAQDSTLRERVALKTIRPGLAAERAAHGFMREIHLARKVTHPNVCRIFDVFHHHDQAAGRDVAFVSMELLAGETLYQHLRGRGKLRPEAALPMLRQMAAALDAAHARGVVHRDFKSGNVMLVAQPDGSTRVVVTDFGLAQGQAGDAFGSFKSTGDIVGTPIYMAPEQVTGGSVGPRADVYALGIVAYEMVAGRPPFVGDSPLATAALRLEQPPPAPRQYAPDLPAHWEQAILRCLARDPSVRFARAGDFPRALERPSRLRSPGVRAMLALLAAAAVSAGTYVALRGRPRAAPTRATTLDAPARAARRSVAVLGFANLSARPDQAWLSTALSEMLGSELAASSSLRLIPGENVARARLELGLAERDELTAERLGSLRRNLAADLVLAGSYFSLGERSTGSMRLDVRVQDAHTGESLQTLIESGNEAELPALVARCGERLRAALAVAPSDPDEMRARHASFAMNGDAARAYAEGLALLRRYAAAAARDRLLQAASAEPRQALIHAALADAWQLLGYEQKAKESAQTALELAANLPREERLLVEAHYKEHAFDWAGAAQTYRTLWNFFPDNLEYGLDLAGAEAKAGRGQAALLVVAALRRLDPPERDDPRIDLAEARAARALSDSKRAEAAAGEAARKGLASGARLIAADARLQQAWALFLLGDTRNVKEKAAEARRLFEEAGDRNGAADATQLTAHVLWMQQGEFASAERLYDEALGVYRATGNRRGVAEALLNVAGPRAEQGHLDGARRLCEEALPVFHEIGDRGDEVAALINLGSLLLQLGALEQAQGRFAEALDLARAIASRSGEANALEGLGHSLLLSGALEPARHRLAEATEIRTALAEQLTAASSRTALSRVLLEQGRPEEAAPDARAVADEMRAAQQADMEAPARVLLAQALLRAGRADEARAAMTRAEQLAPTLGRVGRLKVELAAAHLQALGGERTKGLARLRVFLAEARRSRQVDLQFEARRALAELGEESAEQLARDARAKGFGLYARPPG